jgi:hypothetical protein
MSPEDSDAEDSFRIKRPQRPSQEEYQKLLDLPPREFGPAAARFLVLENPSRIAYTVLRQIYLTLVDDWWRKMLEITERSGSNEEIALLMDAWMAAQEKMEEVRPWLRRDEPPLSLGEALDIVKDSKSEFWRESIMRQVGKRRRPGQPASKRYLALQALDIKCAYPDTSLRQVTDMLCPCGNETHTDSCREQLRQQILRLVKFLRQYGHDFTWAHIQSRGV